MKKANKLMVEKEAMLVEMHYYLLTFQISKQLYSFTHKKKSSKLLEAVTTKEVLEKTQIAWQSVHSR